ncbi:MULTISPECIES: 2-oxo-4-hydroxy-4-carboxy-5-ureidoimidazoline decarboxylase [Tsukamurella]|uniref:2-oxo-4-hydroxy-4-carboxy-5-ureidoimidazoline decarboxylase n=1 Tax=Tsukamurella strandjordii TaxID=147577 RepID=A0AA90NIQ8_9ACTN|nr:MULTISPECIES: 2-oxo-4-hydroxy-4-carboxy-5-ureidoimidazoline decarboxylase [Tsukamurella]MDP0399146.1 2-oxo-4-hydroxy-4-carboxy-5-ureidoimidazoline decarboxylase [Tsukamurella strandjordii]GIZ96008.1 OHCU decarboxylase [Tsukamurella sp. TY48]
MQLSDFNALDSRDAARLVRVWAAVPAWADAVVAARPYGSTAELVEHASALSAEWTAEDLDAALAHHPRIGQRATGNDADARASASEQAAVSDADTAVRAEIAAANAAYESRFGRVFLVRAAGRSAQEILVEAQRRLTNDDATEIAEGLDALREIATLRMRSDLPEEATA